MSEEAIDVTGDRCMFGQSLRFWMRWGFGIVGLAIALLGVLTVASLENARAANMQSQATHDQLSDQNSDIATIKQQGVDIKERLTRIEHLMDSKRSSD